MFFVPSHFGTLHQPPPPWLANPATPPTEKIGACQTEKMVKGGKAAVTKPLQKQKHSL